MLNANHLLISEKEKLENELSVQKAKVLDASDWFLHLSGIPLPQNGYVIIDSFYMQPDNDNRVVLTELSSKGAPNLPEVQQAFDKLGTSPNATATQAFETQLSELVSAFRSPMLGIGNEALKQKLKQADKALQDAVNNPALPTQEKLKIYSNTLSQLKGIVSDLDRVDDHVRLDKLRAVRNYQDLLDESTRLNSKLDDNEAQLDKARQTVANVIWFFNNQELSSRALEKQDPEQYSHWFMNAKEEWDSFESNRRRHFQSP